MLDKIVKKVTHIMESVLSGIVLVAVLVGIVHLYKPFLDFLHSDGSSQEFMNFLGQVLTVVIGVEFFRVLYKPQIKVLLEVLVFVLARHMIVHNLSPIDELLEIVGIAIIVLIRYFVFNKFVKKTDVEGTTEEVAK